MVHEERIVSRLEEIYQCGKQEDNTYSRIAFSKEDALGRDVFSKYLHQLGVNTYFDKAGNMLAHFPGEDEELPAILMGSHLDTVPNGGKYDGAYGCIGALEVMESLIEEKKKLKHPVDIIVFADEEGIQFGKGMVGSTAISGQELTDFDANDKGLDGRTRAEIMKIYGCDFAKIKEAKINPEKVLCFIEMHIEQGRNLDRRDLQVGVVTTIAGVSRYKLTVVGETNHSGSTMMADRKDALVGAADFIRQIPGIIKSNGSSYAVGTVGKLEVTPGAMNVIPGSVEFTLEIREQTNEGRVDLENILFSLLENICLENGLTFKLEKLVSYPCAPMDTKIINLIKDICDRKNLASMMLPSGAFHDAMFMSREFPTGMIFVPSVNGISHAPNEFTKLEDLKTGCEVLQDLLIELDNKY